MQIATCKGAWRYDQYNSMECVFSPAEFFIPVLGYRSYAAWHLSPYIKILPNAGAKLFLKLFGGQPNFSPAAYLVGDDTTVSKCRRVKRSRHDGGSVHEEAELGDPSNTDMRDCHFRSLEGHRLKAVDVCRGDQPDMAVVNLQNTASYDTRVSTVRFPRLLTSSMLFDLVKNRQLQLCECWLLQGFPHPDLHDFFPAVSVSNFPCRALVCNSGGQSSEMLSSSEQRFLLGTSMHANCITSWLFYNLAVTSKPCLAITDEENLFHNFADDDDHSPNTKDESCAQIGG